MISDECKFVPVVDENESRALTYRAFSILYKAAYYKTSRHSNTNTFQSVNDWAIVSWSSFFEEAGMKTD